MGGSLHLIDTEEERVSTIAAVTAFLAVSVISMAAFAVTASRSIAWWENAEYVTAAVTLGVAHPPGSLLLTILGWIVAKIPVLEPIALKLNLLSGLLAAVTAGLVAALATRLFASLELTRDIIPSIGMYLVAIAGAAFGGLVFAFAHTTWLQATKLSPYILTALFTALILCALVRWWRQADRSDGLGWLFLIALLFGLDVSVHRTNIVLLPGVLIWVLLRRPRLYLSLRAWLRCATGLILGLAFQLLLIPISLRDPFLNATSPTSLSRFWDYISLKMYGGSWLVSVFPRKGPFLDCQVHDYLSGFAANFASFTQGLEILGILPALLGLFGLALIWRRDWRLGMGLTALFLSASLVTILLLNVPENFFRHMDRHYLPSFVLFAVWIAYGAAGLLRLIVTGFERRKRNPGGILLVIILLLLWAVGNQLLRNWHAADRSDRYFAEDFGRNLLSTLPADAILFTVGDNDTYPLWYLQAVAQERTDVAVLNLNLLNTTWFLEQIRRRQPTLPLGLSGEEISDLRPIPWKDTTVAIVSPLGPRLYGDSVLTPADDTIYFNISPTLSDSYLRPQDWVVLNIIKQNHWRRPLYFAVTAPESAIAWLRPYLRLEGLANRLVAVSDIQVAVDVMHRNLTERYRYRGYSDPDVFVDDVTRTMTMNYYSLFLQLARQETLAGKTGECDLLVKLALELLPPERLKPSMEVIEAFDQICEAVPAEPE